GMRSEFCSNLTSSLSDWGWLTVVNIGLGDSGLCSVMLRLETLFSDEFSPNSDDFPFVIKAFFSCSARWNTYEIRRAVWNCGENKSPGPDGYTFEFFKKYWSLVGADFCDAVDYFFKSGTFPRGCNSSFIALIPKVNDAKFVNDFRPISLIGCVYKVITKVLANRLATVISDLVSETQSAFVANRQILDGPFILNEVLNWCKRKRKQAMFFKVDFAKAYDSVRWDYLLDILQAFGFGPNWCRWIRGTFTSSMASILVNGSPTSEFPFCCGLKQDVVLRMRRIGSCVLLLNTPFRYHGEDGCGVYVAKSAWGWLGSKGVFGRPIESIRSEVLTTCFDSSIEKISWVAWDNVLSVPNERSDLCTKFDLHVTETTLRYGATILREVNIFERCFWFVIFLRIFPRLFCLFELDKEILVANKIGASSDHSFFRRDVLDRSERKTASGMTLFFNI
ncbi:RNA-directed DNA polymerase, eukaryota, partial [Tanacetum coccineum]